VLKKSVLNIGRITNVILVNFLRINNIDSVHNRKPRKKRGLKIVGVDGFEPPTLPTFSRDALNPT